MGQTGPPLEVTVMQEVLILATFVVAFVGLWLAERPEMP